ncbi:MAG: hypothetical protein ACJ78Q_10085 [Chloroflexia bacterium]
MEATAQLAGFFAAHAIWCVEDGSTLVTMLAFEMPDGTRPMNRLVTEELPESVERGRKWLVENPDGAVCGVLIYDGYVTLDSGKIDALLVNARSYGNEPAGFLMAIPYRHAEKPEGFAVHRPKFLSFEGPEPDIKALAEAFFRGVYQHEKAAEVWDAHMDESV